MIEDRIYYSVVILFCVYIVYYNVKAKNYLALAGKELILERFFMTTSDSRFA